jgi:hypothetical protein
MDVGQTIPSCSASVSKSSPLNVERSTLGVGFSRGGQKTLNLKPPACRHLRNIYKPWHFSRCSLNLVAEA